MLKHARFLTEPNSNSSPKLTKSTTSDKKDTQAADQSENTFCKGKIIVHCSAGRGRTGTIIAAFLIAESLLELLLVNMGKSSSIERLCMTEQWLDRKEVDSDYSDRNNLCGNSASVKAATGTSSSLPRLSVFGIVRRLREQRWGMVSTDA